MTQVKVRLLKDRLDITALNVSFADLPVASASAEVVSAFGGDLDELGRTLREGFADDAPWCRIGNTIHMVNAGEIEMRLAPQPDTPNWHVDWHRTREYLTSAVFEYHHGDTGPRPETVWGNLRFDFSTVSMELVPDP
ncbi:hypothetical protein [Streptomyces sp. WAC08241]|uniref:hypothetical protein n=1 Tax=Streptomyces sp. WAC08241 TaxID=2487421 RepID=UPI000F76F055|nr:hypothetical protein [Streptomyces sp. WAC08241]RSS41860.1 hypothetical protein EF906_13515 [Streptomyces sp. WAC08241]